MMDSLSCATSTGWLDVFVNTGIFALWLLFAAVLIGGVCLLLSSMFHWIINR